MAKAPIPGLAKTRLAAGVGDEQAAEIAACALLDTMTAAEQAVGAGSCVIALTGSLADAARGPEIEAALTHWQVFEQRGGSFAERLACAHVDAGTGALLQVGMDTPQITPELLLQAGLCLEHHDTVLGPAEDGGWWVLGRHDPSAGLALRDVPMSTSSTYADTRAALLAAGLSVAVTVTLTDVDTVAEAAAVATAAPETRFARAWRAAS
ncbi:MAG: DUF2064 domain-containing protein [Nocardioides sp.]